MKSSAVIACIEAFGLRDRERGMITLRQLAAGERAGKRFDVATRLDRLAERLGGLREITPLVLGDKVRDLLHAHESSTRLEDLVLPREVVRDLADLQAERKAAAALASHGLSPRRRVLLHGPPGCGKSSTATALAGELGLPILTCKLSTIIDSYMGATSARLGRIAEEMDRTPGVYLLDEMEVLTAKRTHDGQGADREFSRVTSTLLQLLDHQYSDSVLVGATNRLDLVDPAIRRRFDAIHELPLPGPGAIATAVRGRLARAGLSDQDVWTFSEAAAAAGACFSDALRACDNALRRMVLAGSIVLNPGAPLEHLEVTGA